MAHKGHHVTVVSYFPEKNITIQNYKDLKFDKDIDYTESFNINRYTPMTYWSYFRELIELSEWGRRACQDALQSKVIDDILEIHKKEKFDVILTEFFDTDCMLGVIDRMKVPFIGLSSCALMPWHTDRIGTPDIPSHIPSEFVGFTEKMNFWERFVSYTITKSVKFLYRFTVQWSDNELLAEKFGVGVADVQDVAKETSLIFVNQHYSLHQPRPTTPNLVEIGGIHIQEAKPLPKSIKKILDEAVDGVILMSWGSMINASTMQPHVRKVFTDVFSTISQKVIWKWEGDTIKEMSSNVILFKWLPQRDILCHPNVKLFISHGGMLGTTEAAFCGVATITIPFYGDQPLNGAALEYRGMGVKINYEDISIESVFNAIKKMLGLDAQRNAKFVSEAFKDRPLSALDTAVWWTEYIARTKAQLVRTHARNMNWFVYHSLDVVLALVLACYLTFYVIKKLLVVICVWETKDIGGKSQKKYKSS